MAGQTAAEKLAARAAGVKPPEGDAKGTSAKPPAPPVKAGPVLADYTLFGQAVLNHPSEPTKGITTWLPLGDVKAATYTHALDAAKDALRDKIAAAATEEEPAPATLKLTVAAVASKNWNQGTAIVEMQPVTTWEK